MAGCTSRKDKKVLSDVDNNPKNEITQDKIQLPVDLIKLITDSLDGYSIPTKGDYDTKVNSFIESIPYPYFCKDDFDGNGGNEIVTLNSYTGKISTYNVKFTPKDNMVKSIVEIILTRNSKNNLISIVRFVDYLL